MKKVRAFTLIELIIYLGIFAIISGALTSLVINFIQTSRQINAFGAIQENEKIAINTMSEEIKQSVGVYTPTSVLDVNPGQLSLETKSYLPAQENTTYVDFYIDGKGIYVKRENQTPTRLTSQDVEVSNFNVNLISQAPIPALHIDLSLTSKDLPGKTFPISFTASLRPN